MGTQPSMRPLLSTHLKLLQLLLQLLPLLLQLIHTGLRGAQLAAGSITHVAQALHLRRLSQ